VGCVHPVQWSGVVALMGWLLIVAVAGGLAGGAALLDRFLQKVYKQ